MPGNRKIFPCPCERGQGYDVTEFEGLFCEKPVEWITTAGVDGLMEPIEKRPDFSMTDEEFKAFAEWYLIFSEKREILGNTKVLSIVLRKFNPGDRLLGGRIPECSVAVKIAQHLP